MEFKGTKGGWARYKSTIPSIDKPVSHSVYSQTKRIALCYDLFENDKSKNVTEEEGLANAKLIAAAPDLLEALQEILSMNDVPFRLTRNEEIKINEIARKAIEKALK